jgi:hypothetical protein
MLMSAKFKTVESIYRAFIRKGYPADRALYLATLWQKWYGNKKKKQANSK